MAAPVDAASNVPKQGRGHATANAILRDYFLARYWEMSGVTAAFPGFVASSDIQREVSDPFAEQFVDLQVEHFLGDLDETLRHLKRGIVALQAIRREALAGNSSSPESLRQQFKRRAAEVEDDAGDLHDMVAAVVDLSGRGSARPGKAVYSQDFFGAEVEFLTSRVNQAEDDLKDMFLQPSNVVTVEELRGDNVLTELKSIQRVSKEIRQGL